MMSPTSQSRAQQILSSTSVVTRSFLPSLASAGSVEHGIAWLQNLEEIIIDRNRCPETAKEFLEYELEKDNNGNWKDGFPDKNNHSIDTVRYAMESDMKRSGVSILK